jgi:hypothetical protein
MKKIKRKDYDQFVLRIDRIKFTGSIIGYPNKRIWKEPIKKHIILNFDDTSIPTADPIEYKVTEFKPFGVTVDYKKAGLVEKVDKRPYISDRSGWVLPAILTTLKNIHTTLKQPNPDYEDRLVENKELLTLAVLNEFNHYIDVPVRVSDISNYFESYI